LNEEGLFSEMSRLNNELINLQRELVKKNIELEERNIELKNSENALRDSQHLFAEVANTSPALFWMSGQNGVRIWFNQPWLDFTGRTLKEETEDGWAAGVFPADLQDYLDVYRQAFDARQPFNKEFRLRDRKGDYKWFYDRGNPRFNILGNFLGYIGFCLDISERKKAEEDLKRYTTELEFLNKELESFSYSVSHDLRQPLRAIDGFSRALLDEYGDKLDDQGKDYLGRVRKAGRHMFDSINGLLRLSRLSRAEMIFQQVDLSQIAQSLKEELTDSQPQRNVEFVISSGISVNGDRQLLTTALQNLFANSWKYTSKLHQSRIEFGVTEMQGETVYFIKDNGTGFNMQYSKNLFQPFQRFHSEEEYEGTGIGLAIVQRIIRRHGGKIWAESEKDKGAAFFFTLGSQK
jgi:PAS domain S-box-containing protein